MGQIADPDYMGSKKTPEPKPWKLDQIIRVI